MSYAPALVVNAPARKPLRNGIFEGVEWINPGSTHWLNGIEWEALPHTPASGIGSDVTGVPSTGTGLPLEFPFVPVTGEAEAFTVVATYDASTIGHALDYAQSRARDLLEARKQARVEQAMWTGDLGNADNAFETNATPLGAGMSPVEALAACEEWIGNVYGSEGLIHVTRSMATYLANGYLVSLDNDGVLRTALGTQIIAGAGYTPAAGDDIVVTPPLFGIKSDVFDTGQRVVNKSTNDVLGLVEQSFVIGYDPVGCAKASVTLPV